MTPEEPEEPEELLTPLERDIVDRLGGIASDFRLLVAEGRTRNADINEACLHIHALQYMVLSQAAARAYPGQYRLKGESLSDERE